MNLLSLVLILDILILFRVCDEYFSKGTPFSNGYCNMSHLDQSFEKNIFISVAVYSGNFYYFVMNKILKADPRLCAMWSVSSLELIKKIEVAQNHIVSSPSTIWKESLN